MRRLAIGLMSGTSVDAVDAALVELRRPGPAASGAPSAPASAPPGSGSTFARLVHARAHPIPDALRHELIGIAQGASVTLGRLGELDTLLGETFARAALRLMAEARCDPREIAVVGSHGQTIWHQPEGPVPATIQIGDASIIAERTGLPTVADFRRRDLAAGGQGAPLVCPFHQVAFQHPERARAIVNVGGILNVTLLPPGRHGEPHGGFDVGPGNTLLDAWCVEHRGTPFDRDGAWGRGGRVDQALLERLLADPYFELPPPKSTGRARFGTRWLHEKVGGGAGSGGDPVHGPRAQDVQRTLHELVAILLARALDRWGPGIREVYLCGGGAANGLLRERIRNALAPREVATTSALGLHPDWVEAAAFAWLAVQRLDGLPGNAPGVTGARHPVVLGALHAGRQGCAEGRNREDAPRGGDAGTPAPGPFPRNGAREG